MDTELDLFKTGSSLGALRHNIDYTISGCRLTELNSFIINGFLELANYSIHSFLELDS